MALTDTAIRAAKPAEKTVKLFDEKGLYLELSPAGGKWWRLKYRFGGKEKRISLGTYPDVALKQARERRDEARKLLADGIDPGEHRKAQKAAGEERAANSFEVVAREWYAKMATTWVPSHGEKIIRRLERGKRPVPTVLRSAQSDALISSVTSPSRNARTMAASSRVRSS